MKYGISNTIYKNESPSNLKQNNIFEITGREHDEYELSMNMSYQWHLFGLIG